LKFDSWNLSSTSNAPPCPRLSEAETRTYGVYFLTNLRDAQLFADFLAQQIGQFPVPAYRRLLFVLRIFVYGVIASFPK
jgi:hypothetical protein